jgi:hypothetical protein
VKEWLKRYLVRKELTDALQRRIVEGKVELEPAHENPVEEPQVEKPLPKPMPK